MKLIQKLCEQIEEEVCDSKHYAMWAVELKDEHRNLADVLYSLSLDEMKHADALHEEVVDLIDEYRKEHGEPPANMLAVYEYLHKRQIEKAEEARRYQQMYKEL